MAMTTPIQINSEEAVLVVVRPGTTLTIDQMLTYFSKEDWPSALTALASLMSEGWIQRGSDNQLSRKIGFSLKGAK